MGIDTGDASTRRPGRYAQSVSSIRDREALVRAIHPGALFGTLHTCQHQLCATVLPIVTLRIVGILT